MKKILATLAACLIVLGMHAQISQEAYKTWHQNKYSMFIHFGLYSELGGVWEGKPSHADTVNKSSHLPEFSATGTEILPCISIPQLSMPTPL